MPRGFSRIYVFRSPNDPDQSTGYSPYRKLMLIIAVILGLYVLDVFLTGTDAMIGKLLDTAIFIPVILISLTFHEFCHAWMADFLGDPTPRQMGRLSLDPRRHLDLFGTLLLFFANFGWAKPVPVNPDNFRVRDRAMMSVALAGPLSNLFLAVCGGLLLRLYTLFITLSGNNMSMAANGYFERFCIYCISINLGLAFFNLIPLPPLDGSKVVTYFLSPRERHSYKYIEEMGPFLLILLVSMGFVGMIVGPLVKYSAQLILRFFF